MAVSDKPFTCRGVLSTVNSLFDPLGFVAPVTIRRLALLRELSTEVFDWDADLPVDKLNKWETWKRSLQDLSCLHISCSYIQQSLSSATYTELCLFSDFSYWAIRAEAYLRVITPGGQCRVGFVLGKAKPEPTIPHPAKPMVRQVRVDDEAKLTDKEVQDLKAQIEMLQSQVSELTIGSLKATTKLSKEAQTEKQSKAKSTSEVQALKKHVESLQNQIGVMTVTHTETRPTRGSSWRADPRENKGSHDFPNRQSYKGQPRDRNDRDDFFCYRCGEDGHVATRCTAPEDSAKVIQKLVRTLRRHKEHNNREQTNPHKETQHTHCSIKRSAVDHNKPGSLPEGLVGETSLSKVIIEGQPLTAPPFP